jgi:hypothetical protein
MRLILGVTGGVSVSVHAKYSKIIQKSTVIGWKYYEDSGFVGSDVDKVKLRVWG